jgi:protein-arginine kinase activator protein McsA
MDNWNKTHCDRCHEIVKQGEGIYAERGFYHHETCYRAIQQEFIDAYEWDEYKTFAEDEMICPYCGYVGTDSCEYSEDEGVRECGRCGKEYDYVREVKVSYSTTPKEAE